ncbi:unnamed protein product [Mytilus edulis]|uniref:B box-type domain-containing protein n=1 Tax=Mytilus edulis TaxID=6550 RepID=A0A8S3VBM0_MYTED|nr:unnamed protein product [Mytilus edulis]
MPLDFFCSDHDSLLCQPCIANTHHICGKILPIDVAAKGIKSSVMFDDISKYIAALRKFAKELVQDREKTRKDSDRPKVYIAIIPHTEETVVSLADAKIIQFVNIVSLVSGRQLQVTIKDSNMYGIAVVCDILIVGGSSGNVYFIEKTNGKCLKTVKIGTGTISSIVPFIRAKDEVLYGSEYSGNKKVHSLKLDGTFISNCELENPIGMTFDSKRNVYVSCYDFGELHRLTADCEVDIILLTKSDKLDNPVSVAFNKTYSKLYVSNSGSDESILVFNCK